MMKKHSLFLLSFLITVTAVWSGSLTAINNPGNRDSEPVKIPKGERPEPDYSGLSNEAIIPGLIRIKIRNEFKGDLNIAALSQDSGNINFGLPGLDLINRETGVYAASQSFTIALRDRKFETRHRDWGLHLWYDLRVSEKAGLQQLREQYAGLPEIEYAELLTKLIPSSTGSTRSATWTPNDSLFPQMWHFNNTGQSGGTPGSDIDLPEAWELERGDTSVIVAIMDAGVDWIHPDLLPNMWPGIGYNFFADTSWVEPCFHGTHVAGTIAASTNNHNGVSGIAGGDGSGNGVRIMTCQIISSQNTVVEENIPNAYIWAADQGAAISQNSWNYPIASPSMLDAIDYFIAYGGGTMINGGIVICSAGNDDTNHISYPCCYEPCLAVAATSDTDEKSFFSNYGPWVDLSAPGGNSITNDIRNILSTVPGPGYAWGMGTSMACPHVSGVAALVISLANERLSPFDVKEILLNSTDDIYPLNPVHDGMLGSGRLNAFRALQYTQQYMDYQIPRPPLAFTASGDNNGQISLIWSTNAQEDSLLLAYSINPVFGVPTGSYLEEDTIVGGGTVLLKGKTDGFLHDSLERGNIYYYRLWTLRNNRYSPFGRSACDTVKSSPFAINDIPGSSPAEIRVVPNPVNGSAMLSFILESQGEVSIHVFDQTGRLVVHERINFNSPGRHKHEMDTGGWATGVYTVRIHTGSRLLNGKMAVL